MTIVLEFDFEGEATMDLSVYGMPKLRPIRPTEPPHHYHVPHWRRAYGSTTTPQPEYWIRALPINKDQSKSIKNNRLEKARLRVIDREVIDRRDKGTMAIKRKKERKSNSTRGKFRTIQKNPKTEAIQRQKDKIRFVKERKLNSKERRLRKKHQKIQSKGGIKSAEQSYVSRTTESRNIFVFNISQQGRDSIYNYFMNKQMKK